MAAIDPQQELFSKLLTSLKAKGLDVYDGYLPPEGTPYPFVYLGECQQTDDTNKSAVFGNVYMTIHVWHDNPKQRGNVSMMLAEIKSTCRRIGKTQHFSWHVQNITQRIMSDTTTKQPLLHGIVEVDFKFS